MPAIYHLDTDPQTRLAVWSIQEPESWFLERLPASAPVAHPVRRLHHLAGRYLLTHLEPGFPHAAVVVSEGGKPYLADGSCHFSISHSRDMAAGIISHSNGVGVDLEFVTSRVLRIVPRFLGNTERDWVSSLPECIDSTTGTIGGAEACRLCTLLWSAKESAFKWFGRPGLDFATDLLTEPFERCEAGEIKARCRKDGETPFRIGYRFFDELCLTWVVEPLPPLSG